MQDKSLILLVRLAGIEPTTLGFGGRGSANFSKFPFANLVVILTHPFEFVQSRNIGRAASAGHEGPANALLEGVVWQSVRRMAAQVAYEKFGDWALGRARNAPP